MPVELTFNINQITEAHISYPNQHNLYLDEAKKTIDCISMNHYPYADIKLNIL